jgi:hypothetical protein
MLPGDVQQLAPFFDPPIDSTLLHRYEMLQSGKYSDVAAGSQMAVAGLKSPVDVERDSYWRIGPNGFSVQSFLSQNVSAARKAYASVHEGQRETDPAELLPFLKWPVDAAVLEKYLTPTPQ